MSVPDDFYRLVILDVNGDPFFTKNIYPALGRFYIKDYVQIDPSVNKDPVTYLLYIDVRSFCYLYPNDQSKTPSDRIVGEYYSINHDSLKNDSSSFDITSYIVDGVIDVHQYPYSTFIANCVNSSSDANSTVNYGGVSPEVCQVLYDNERLQPNYPVSMTGDPPEIPDPTPFDTGSTSTTYNWHWVWIAGIIIVLITILIITFAVVTRTNNRKKVEKCALPPKQQAPKPILNDPRY